MKKTLRIVAIVMVAVMLCLCLSSCTKLLSGEYYTGDKSVTKTYTTYTFKGNRFVVESYLLGNKVGDESFEGKYEIKGDEIIFTYEDSKGEKQTTTKTFKELEDGSIKIGMVTYKKVDK